MFIRKNGITFIEIVFYLFCIIFYTGVSGKSSNLVTEYQKIAKLIQFKSKGKNTIENSYGHNKNIYTQQTNNLNTVTPKTSKLHYNILLVGLDSVEGTFRTDTIILVGISIKHNRISLLSIPRDTKVEINNSNRKINEVLPRFGHNGLRSTLENMLDVKIDNYVEISYESFIRIIDLIGGIRIYIDQPMHYDDYSGKLHIHFDKGWHHLDGAKALNYVRFRADALADLGRIKRQQKFIYLLLQKFKSPTNFIKLPLIINEIYKHLKTDITINELSNIIKSIDLSNVEIKTFSLPGEANYIDRISFYIFNATESQKITAIYFTFNELLEFEKSFSINNAKYLPTNIVSSMSIIHNATSANKVNNYSKFNQDLENEISNITATTSFQFDSYFIENLNKNIIFTGESTNKNSFESQKEIQYSSKNQLATSLYYLPFDQMNSLANSNNSQATISEAITESFENSTLYNFNNNSTPATFTNNYEH